MYFFHSRALNIEYRRILKRPSYIHYFYHAPNRSEHLSDYLGLEMQFGMKDNIGLILEKRRFILHVNVTPVNDPPVLALPHNKVLRLIQGIPKILGPDLIVAIDPDSSNSSLIFTVLLKPVSIIRKKLKFFRKISIF